MTMCEEKCPGMLWGCFRPRLRPLYLRNVRAAMCIANRAGNPAILLALARVRCVGAAAVRLESLAKPRIGWQIHPA
jgi:hypothetical protein